MFSESWFYQCTCFAGADDENTLSSDANISIVDENGQEIYVDNKPSDPPRKFFCPLKCDSCL